MRETHKNGSNSYISGGAWHECASCGFDTRLSELKKNSNGSLVCSKCYDPPKRNTEA